MSTLKIGDTVSSNKLKEYINYEGDNIYSAIRSMLLQGITTGTLTVNGNSTTSGTETVNNFKDNGSATISGDLSVNGNSTTSGTETVNNFKDNGSATISGDLSVGGSSTLNGPVLINPGDVGQYNEGLRVGKATSRTSVIVIGAEGTTGVTDGAWWIGANIDTYGRKLYISHNGAWGTGYFWADSSTSGTSGLNISKLQSDSLTTSTITLNGSMTASGTITGTLSGLASYSSIARSLGGLDGSYYHVSTGVNCITAGMTNNSFENSPANDWAHYLIFNHGDGTTYFNFTLRLPFHDQQVPQYQRRDNGTLTGWHNFITDENSDATIEAKLLKGATINNLTITGTTTSSSSATFSGSVNASYFTATSSRKAKDNIKAFKGSALSILDNTKIVSFNYKADENKSFKIGFIAEDTHPYLSGEKQERFDIDNSIGLLIKAVQELDKKIEKIQRGKNVDKSNRQ